MTWPLRSITEGNDGGGLRKCSELSAASFSAVGQNVPVGVSQKLTATQTVQFVYLCLNGCSHSLLNMTRIQFTRELNVGTGCVQTQMSRKNNRPSTERHILTEININIDSRGFEV